MVWEVIYLFHYVGIPKGKTFVVCWVFFHVLPLIEGLVSLELNKPKGVVLRIDSVCIEGGICILPSCLTLVNHRIILR